MEQVTLHGAGLRVSRLCFGNMTFGGQTGEATSARILDVCLDHGINFIDTANIYNKGVSEEILGRLLKGKRDKIVLASKVRGAMGPGPDESGLSRAAILKAIDDSLRRLQTDYVDLYYLHQPDYNVPIEETLDTIAAIVKAGKVRNLAISNYAAWQVAQAHAISERKGYAPPRVAQMMYNLVARGLEQEFVPFAKEYGVSIVVYNPLAGGILTGKQQRQAPLPGTRFDNNQMYLDRYWRPEFFDAVDELAVVAEKAGRSLVSLSLNWLLHHTAADVIILGASRLEQLLENFKAAEEGPLTEDTLTACDEVWARLRGPSPKYNR
ncbi:MAG: aldo/keto reductase [Bryobacterales bacterium]|nr:aldo/keto reductase [Bryobacterales bacterium]